MAAAKDTRHSNKSASLKVVLQNSAAVVLGCCKCMLQHGLCFGKGKVRDAVLRIASDFLAFANPLVMRAGAQTFGVLSRIEDDVFKSTIIQYLYKKKFGDDKANVRAAAALALGCTHQYTHAHGKIKGKTPNLSFTFTVAALQLLKCYAQGDEESEEDEAICRNILGFTLSILADEKDCVDARMPNALLEILNILLSRNRNSKGSEEGLLSTIIFVLKFMKRHDIPELLAHFCAISLRRMQKRPPRDPTDPIAAGQMIQTVWAVGGTVWRRCHRSWIEEAQLSSSTCSRRSASRCARSPRTSCTTPSSGCSACRRRCCRAAPSWLTTSKSVVQVFQTTLFVNQSYFRVF